MSSREILFRAKRKDNGEEEMTEKQALSELKASIEGCGFQCHPETYTKAIQALEKQIPKKLDYEGDGYDDSGNLVYDIAICRKCNRNFEVYYDEHFTFCPDCGQALDWSDSDE